MLRAKMMSLILMKRVNFSYCLDLEYLRMMNLLTGIDDSRVQSNRGERDRNYRQAQ